MHVIAMQEAFPVTKPEPEQVTADFDGLVAVFRHAKSKLKFPKVRLMAEDGTPVRFSVAGGRSKHEGTIGITDDGVYPDNRWFGRIHQDGRFEKGRHLTPEVEKVIRDFAADPAATAAAHGQKWGHCTFCNLKLTDDRSRFVGYGEVCAGHFGLPWGQKTEESEVK
jgi:hypothetical protein